MPTPAFNSQREHFSVQVKRLLLNDCPLFVAERLCDRCKGYTILQRLLLMFAYVTLNVCALCTLTPLSLHQEIEITESCHSMGWEVKCRPAWCLGSHVTSHFSMLLSDAQ